jgi:hypothetical protein
MFKSIAMTHIAAPGSVEHSTVRRAFNWHSIAQQSISPQAILDGGIRLSRDSAPIDK